MNDIVNINIMNEEQNAFNGERYQAIISRLADELARGTTLRHIATDTTISIESLSIWMEKPCKHFYSSSRYANEISTGEKYEAKITAWLDENDAARAAQPYAPEYVDITVSRNVIEGLKKARALGKLFEISAASGTGKTQGVIEYERQCRKTEGFACPVWKMKLNESNLTLKIIYQEMYAKIKNSKPWERASSLDEMGEYSILCAIKDELEGRKKGGLFIIDEAQHIGKFHGLVRPNAQMILNGLRDITDDGLAGIALLCNGEVYEQASTGKKRSVQLSSRMAVWRKDAKKNTADDIDKIMAAWNVSGKEERILSVKIGLGEGGMRVLTDIYENALYDYGVINAKTISSSM